MSTRAGGVPLPTPNTQQTCESQHTSAKQCAPAAPLKPCSSVTWSKWTEPASLRRRSPKTSATDAMPEFTAESGGAKAGGAGGDALLELLPGAGAALLSVMSLTKRGDGLLSVRPDEPRWLSAGAVGGGGRGGACDGVM